ncbi:hypothetical protein SKAU_G00193120 [Synaphobranchus kaupii]|uniref:PiggyBac transposable element-derived protein domain-containing protein n=1 Tax=Synaphobranchus kaupii TaxID=118154 RepID=A0A9Q1FEE6_SYNKA|nr:hypothetical protein SKAU_G00193120 [Synaphobranchus kaupii]
MFTNSRRIREIFFNSDDEGDYNTESSGSDSDSEERLPPNLVSLERNPELGEGDDDVEENPEEGPSVVPCSRPEGPVPVEEVRSSDWRTAVDFTPPGPGIEFDSSISGVQNPPETPTEVNCFKMFLSVETVGEIVEETNRYAKERMPYKDFRLKLMKELIQEHPLPRRSTGGATLRQHPTAAHREALSFFCASYRSPGIEHKAALQSLPLHHPTQKGREN